MSQHSSLKTSSVGVKHRNVLKRFERLKKIQEMSSGRELISALKLPKIKSMKIKVKKAKAEKAEGQAEGATGSTTPTPAAAPAKTAKPAAAKGKA